MEKIEIEKMLEKYRVNAEIGREMYNKDMEKISKDFTYDYYMNDDYKKSVVDIKYIVSPYYVIITIKFKNNVFYLAVNDFVTMYKKYGYEPLDFNMNKHTLSFTKDIEKYKEVD